MHNHEAICLKRGVAAQHSCRATLTQTAAIREAFQGQPIREGVVHMFDRLGQPNATRAYAWSSTFDRSEKRGFYAVLGICAIKSRVDPVRAVMLAEHKRT